MEGHCLAKANKAEFMYIIPCARLHQEPSSISCQVRVIPQSQAVPSRRNLLRWCGQQYEHLSTAPLHEHAPAAADAARAAAPIPPAWPRTPQPTQTFAEHACPAPCAHAAVENGPCGPPGNGADVGSCTSDCGGGGCGDRGALPAVFAAKRLLPGLAAAPAAPAPTWGLGSPTSLAKRLLMASLWLCT
eukprot:scaffold113782_cov23-Tisochrysis_lutea.AAC.1